MEYPYPTFTNMQDKFQVVVHDIDEARLKEASINLGAKHIPDTKISWPTQM